MSDQHIEEVLEISDSFLVESKDFRASHHGTVVERKEGTDMPADQDLIDDYNFSRETLQDLMLKGGKLLNDAIRVAEESKHPRALEVAANVMRQISDISKDLIDLSGTMSKMQQDQGKSPETVENHNHIHVGTTAELARTLQEIRNAKDDGDS